MNRSTQILPDFFPSPESLSDSEVEEIIEMTCDETKPFDLSSTRIREIVAFYEGCIFQRRLDRASRQHLEQTEVRR